jgi:hypothetical protein
MHYERMSDATHATVITLRRDLSREADQKQALQHLIERGFHVIPGFVSGLWTFDREACETVTIHTFDSLDAAEAFAVQARNNAAGQAALGLELLSVRVNEITHSA